MAAVSTHSNFHELIASVRAGDADAASELHQTYGEQIQRIVRVRLTDPGLRRQMDSIDVCQSVFADFFVRMALGQYDIAEPADLLKLLTTMARNRVIHHAQKQKAARRDVRRTEGADVGGMPLAGSEDTPSQIVAAKELLDRFQGELTAEEQRIADQRREGRSWDEIAAELGRSAEAVRKQHARAMNRVSRQLGLEEFPDG